MATEISGLTTEELLDEIGKLVRPMRPDEFGVTLEEVKTATNITNHKAAKSLTDDLGLVCINMRNSDSGKPVHVYATPESAEQYQDWIIEE